MSRRGLVHLIHRTSVGERQIRLKGNEFLLVHLRMSDSGGTDDRICSDRNKLWFCAIGAPDGEDWKPSTLGKNLRRAPGFSPAVPHGRSFARFPSGVRIPPVPNAGPVIYRSIHFQLIGHQSIVWVELQITAACQGRFLLCSLDDLAPETSDFLETCFHLPFDGVVHQSLPCTSKRLLALLLLNINRIFDAALDERVIAGESELIRQNGELLNRGAGEFAT